MKPREIRLVSWNVAYREAWREQLAALRDEAPDLLALQDARPDAWWKMKAEFSKSKLRYVAKSFGPSNAKNRARRAGIVIASRWPVRVLRKAKPGLAWNERLLSVSISSDAGTIELHTAYIPHGSGHTWRKISTLEAIFKHLARLCPTHRLFCGDLNTPKEELPDGRTVTWAQRSHAGRVVMERWSGSLRWHLAEWDILKRLAAFDLHDVFRLKNGYQEKDFSWRHKRKGKTVRRRYDHVFASDSLRPISCRYLHTLRLEKLSDHAPMEVRFRPHKL